MISRSLPLALLLLGVVGCASTPPTASSGNDATTSLSALESYLDGNGFILVRRGVLDPALLTVNNETYTLDGGMGLLRVYQFDSSADMQAGVLQLSSRPSSFSPDWTLFRGGNLVVVYRGQDPGVLSALSRVMTQVV